MYEQMRNEFAMRLACVCENESIPKILNALDMIMGNYEVSKMETSLAVRENGVPEIVELYLYSKLMENKSKKTIQLYGSRLRIFFETMRKSPEEVTTNEIRIFLAKYQAGHNISGVTLDKFRQIIDGFYEWSVNEGYIPKNPCRNINKIKFTQKPRRALSRMELELLRREVKNDKRMLAIVDTLFSTGCRVSELSNIKFSDINKEEKSVNIIGKGQKHNICYFNTDAIISLNEYIKTRNDTSEYLFVSKYNEKLSINMIEQMFRKISERLDFKVTPHVIRHTTATIALQNGMPIEQVQRILGHSSVSTTQVYAETSQNDVRVSHMRYVV